MKRLTAEQIKQLDVHQAKINALQKAFASEAERCNADQQKLWTAVQTAIQAYNDYTAQARVTVERAATDLETAYGEAEVFLIGLIKDMDASQ